MSVAPALADDGATQKAMIHQLNDARDKIIELAEATPDNKYSYRPGKDVRSTGEVFMHVVQANYFLATFIGVKPPEGVTLKDMDKSSPGKAKTIEMLKASFAHAENAIQNTSDADLDKPVDLFGTPSTWRDAEMIMVTHAHEHLGQSIAYARMNKIVPPWTARQEAAAAAKAKSK